LRGEMVQQASVMLTISCYYFTLFYTTLLLGGSSAQQLANICFDTRPLTAPGMPHSMLEA